MIKVFLILLLFIIYVNSLTTNYKAYDRSNPEKIYYGIVTLNNHQLTINNNITLELDLDNIYNVKEQTYDIALSQCNGNLWDINDYIICEKNNIVNYIVGYNLLITIDNLEFPFYKKIKTKIITNKWYYNKNICHLPWIKNENCIKYNFDIINTTKTCIFFHGAGEKLDQHPVNEFIDYWGHINKYTPYCKERWFIRRNTTDKGWDDIELQKDFCEISFTRMIKSLIIR
jgi:hypothetical protein